MSFSEIPDLPRIHVNNYVSKLSDKVRIILFEDVISEYIDDNALNEISSETGFLKSSLKKYVRNRKYPVFFLKTLNKLIDVDVFKLIEQSDAVFFSKWKLIKLPKYITPKLAYFVGYLQGDGCLESNGRRVSFTDEYVFQMKKVNQICFELFNIKGVINPKQAKFSKKPAYSLTIGSLVLSSFLHKIFNINMGKKLNLQIPSIFIENKAILKWYLAGLFDADGTLPKQPRKCKQLFVDITLKDKEFINQIKKALNLFEIKTLNLYCRRAKSPNSDYISETWELRIRRKNEIIKFLKIIGFYHPDKEIRAKKLLAYVGH